MLALAGLTGLRRLAGQAGTPLWQFRDYHGFCPGGILKPSREK